MDFSLPANSNSLIVPILSFVAIDDLGVTGYRITTTTTQPLATAAGWSATPPTSYTFTSAGTKTLYAWAKDAAGNVSFSLSDTVVVATPDNTPPVVTAFRIPRTSNTLTVPITQFTATDDHVVAGYMVTTNSTRPSWSSPNWSPTRPASYTFSSGGTRTLYPWARDAAGNVSAVYRGSYMTVNISVSNQAESD
jgi:hypothetical protein